MNLTRQETDPRYIALLIMAFAILLDGLSTYLAINHAGMAEINPVVNAMGGYGASLLVRVGVLLIYYRLIRNGQTRRLFMVFLAIAAGLTLAVGLWNMFGVALALAVN